ncbi:MAG: methionyl-tRNA formyltransferase [Candidatus Paceibacteria bacterium]
MERLSRIVFFGTSSFALPALEALCQKGLQPVLVITTPDAPVGRKQILAPSPVKIKARALGLSVYDPKTLKSEEVISRISQIEPEVGVLAAYGKILPKALIDLFPNGILNIHPSLLPRWRGPTPVQSAILAGDEKTGVTIFLIDEELDHGAILAQKELEIENLKLETYQTLHDKLAKLGAELLLETLPLWLEGKITPLPQNHNQATFSKKFTRKDAKIDWQKSAVEIDRLVRALNPEPGVWAIWNKPRGTTTSTQTILKILEGEAISNLRNLESKNPGEIFEYEGKLAIKCGDGALILRTIQPEGKKPMSGEDFLHGHKEIIGKILC